MSHTNTTTNFGLPQFITYDALELTATVYDSYELTAYDYDFNGKNLLV